MARYVPLLALMLLAGLLVPAAPGARADEAPVAATAQRTARSIEDLTSPFERTRRGAVRDLVAGLPDTREAVIAALPGAAPAVQLLLVEVLAADASLPAIRALLGTMGRADESLAVRIRLLLVRDDQTAGRVLEAWEVDPDLRQGPDGRITERTRILERLLRRAEAERLFVSRKSRTGSTGSYRGQYSVLEPYREEALEVCVGILLDRAIRVPGVYTAGTFAFLRPPPIHVRTSELIGMAAHAFSELARPTDSHHVLTLSKRLLDLWIELERTSYFDDVRFGDLLNQYADLLVALYLVRPESFRARLEEFLANLESPRNRVWRNALGTSYRPIVLLRVGRHEEAVRELEQLLGFDELVLSMASAHYNLACAYAQWGEGLEGPERAHKLTLALDHLQQAVENQWLDIGWMDQDRDLEPIRDTPRYRRLAEQVRKELIPERAPAPPDGD